MTTLPSTQIKLVVTFDLARTETVIKNYVRTTLLPALESKVRQRVESSFTVFNVENKKLALQQTSQTNRWQASMKVTVSGEFTISQNQLKTGYNNMIDVLKSDIKTALESQGGTVIEWHLHLFDSSRRDIE